MPRLAPFALMAVLAGCAGAALPPPAPELRFRDPNVPVRSIAGFDPARMAGEWGQAASLVPDGVGCGAGRLSVVPAGNGALGLSGSLCLGGRMVPMGGRAVPSGPGRLYLTQEGRDWWVIWADWDMRTLVLADPKGSFGVVLDRGRISSDRLKAAREILAFNGYYVSALR